MKKTKGICRKTSLNPFIPTLFFRSPKFKTCKCCLSPSMINLNVYCVFFGSNLGHNGFPIFPSVGLENALHIKVHNNPNLREFPLPSSFPRVKTLALSYAYHCCPFQQSSSSYSILNGVGEDSSLRDSIIFPSSEHGIDLTAWARGETVWTDSSKKFSTTFFFQKERFLKGVLCLQQILCGQT